MPNSNSGRYDRVAIILHWLIALLMIPMIFFGENMMEVESEGAEEAAASTFLPSLHVSIGVTILVLTLIRLFWRIANPPPALPAGMASWELAVTKVVHGLFYVLMLGLPLSGWLSFPGFIAEEAGMSAISLFGFAPVPLAPSLGIPAAGIHEVGSKVAIALLILHVLAALKHQFINRDGLLARMSPH